MTLLQRGVIHRLREAGLQGFADEAWRQWSRGERTAPLWNLISGYVPHADELRADFERADLQNAAGEV